MNDKPKTKLEEFGGVTIEQLPAVAPAAAPPMPMTMPLPMGGGFGVQRFTKRDENKVRAKLRDDAAAYGDGWLYRFPVSEGGAKKMLVGPSIKLANDLARAFGNCNVGAQAYDAGDSWMIQAYFVDVEGGFSMVRPFEQPKSGSKMRVKDPERAQAMALQIGVSKAIRNVVANALQSLCDFAIEEAKAAIVTKIGGKLEYYRDKMRERLDELGVPVRKVELSVGRPIAKWCDTDMARVISQVQAIQDGMTTPEDVFGVAPVEDATVVEAAPEPKPEAKAKPERRARKKKAPAPEPAGEARAAEAASQVAESAKPAKAARRAPGGRSKEAAPKAEPPCSPLQVKTALFKAGSCAALDEVWVRYVDPFAWPEEELAEFVKFRDACYARLEAKKD